jgi:hypothetical protein
MANSDNVRQGNWVEALFLARATAEGLQVAKPWSGVLRYDFLVEADGRTCRVQVKSCSHKRDKGGYICNYGCSRHPRYTAEQFEFVVIYVIPEDVWYVIPIAAVAGISTRIVLFPHSQRSKYCRFKEAWHLLSAPTSAKAGQLEEELQVSPPHTQETGAPRPR